MSRRTQQEKAPRLTPEAGLERAIRAAGSKAELARRLKIRREAVKQWSRVPEHQIKAVERETGIRREILRPDLYLD